MSKVKANAIDITADTFVPVGAVQSLAATSSAWNQINSFSHQYDRGGNSRSMANPPSRWIKPLPNCCATVLPGTTSTTAARSN
jgi:hypothetical protein